MLEQVYGERFATQDGFFRPYVKQVIYRFLDCGIIHNGFARVKCEDCGHEYLLGFSCKRRHFCPSRHQKRVAGLSAAIASERNSYLFDADALKAELTPQHGGKDGGFIIVSQRIHDILEVRGDEEVLGEPNPIIGFQVYLRSLMGRVRVGLET